MLANLISHLFYKLFLKILIRFVIFLCVSNLCFYKKMRNDTYLTILKSLVSHLFSHFETPFQLVWNLLLNFSPIWSFWKLFFHFFSLSKRNELSDENFYLFSHRNFFLYLFRHFENSDEIPASQLFKIFSRPLPPGKFGKQVWVFRHVLQAYRCPVEFEMERLEIKYPGYRVCCQNFVLQHCSYNSKFPEDHYQSFNTISLILESSIFTIGKTSPDIKLIESNNIKFCIIFFQGVLKVQINLRLDGTWLNSENLSTQYRNWSRDQF